MAKSIFQKTADSLNEAAKKKKELEERRKKVPKTAVELRNLKVDNLLKNLPTGDTENGVIVQRAGRTIQTGISQQANRIWNDPTYSSALHGEGGTKKNGTYYMINPSEKTVRQINAGVNPEGWDWVNQKTMDRWNQELGYTGYDPENSLQGLNKDMTPYEIVRGSQKGQERDAARNEVLSLQAVRQWVNANPNNWGKLPEERKEAETKLNAAKSIVDETAAKDNYWDLWQSSTIKNSLMKVLPPFTERPEDYNDHEDEYNEKLYDTYHGKGAFKKIKEHGTREQQLMMSDDIQEMWKDIDNGIAQQVYDINKGLRENAGAYDLAQSDVRYYGKQLEGIEYQEKKQKEYEDLTKQYGAEDLDKSLHREYDRGGQAYGNMTELERGVQTADIHRIYSFVSGGKEYESWIVSDNPQVTSEYNYAMLMTDGSDGSFDEVGTFMGLYNKAMEEGREPTEAKAFLDGLQSTLQSRYSDYNKIYVSNAADKVPILSSIASQMMKSADAYLAIPRTIAGWLGDEEVKNPNSFWYKPTTDSDIIENTVAENIGGFGGKIYKNLMNTVSNVYRGLTTPATGKVGQTIMGLGNFFLQVYQESTARNLQNMDYDKASIAGAVDGMFEVFEEFLPFETMLGSGGKNIATALLMNGLAELGQEGIGGTVFEKIKGIITGEDSEDSNADEILHQGYYINSAGEKVPLSEDRETALQQARAEAARQFWMNGLEQGAAGFFGGSVGGTFGVAQQALGLSQTGKTIRKENNTTAEGVTGETRLVDTALQMPETESAKLAAKIKEKISQGKKVSNYHYGKLAATMMEETNEQAKKIVEDTIETEITRQLNERGLTGLPAEEAAKAIAKTLNGKMTGAASRTIAENQASIEVWKSFNTNPDTIAQTAAKIEEATAPQRSVAELLGDLTADAAKQVGAMSLDVKEAVKNTDTPEAAIDYLQEKRSGLVSEKYANAAKEVLEQNPDAKKSKTFVDDAMKIRLAAMSLNPAMPKTNLQRSDAEKLWQAAKDEFDENEAQRVVKMKPVEPGKGTATFEGVEYGTDEWKDKINGDIRLSGKGKLQVHTLAEVAKRVGMQLNFIYDDSEIGQDVYGFQSDGNGITINLAAANRSGRMSHHMMVTMAHEMTHWLETNSKQGYADLRQYVLKELRAKGMNIEQRMLDIIDNQNAVLKSSETGETLDLNGAMAEIVAQSCENMLSSRDFRAKIAEENPDLNKNIMTFVRQFKARLDAAIQGMDPSLSREAALLKNKTDEIAKIWLGAQQEALGRSEEGAEPSVTVRYSLNRQTEQKLNAAYDTAVQNGNWQKAESVQMDRYDQMAKENPDSGIETDRENSLVVAGGARYSLADQRIRNRLQREMSWNIEDNQDKMGKILQKYNIPRAERTAEALAAGVSQFADIVSKADLKRLQELENENKRLAGKRESYATLDENDPDARYMEAWEKGTWEGRAEMEDMVSEKIAETEGVTPYKNADLYTLKDAQQVANLIKEKNPEAIAIAAAKMAPLIPKNAVLVPMPNHHGVVDEDTDTMALARAISEITGRPVMNAMAGAERQSRRENKQSTTAEDLGFRQTEELPEGTIPYFVDNLVAAGVTAKAAHDAFGKGVTVAYAKTSRGAVDGLKEAGITYYDKQQTRPIPISERMNMAKTGYEGVRFSVGQTDIRNEDGDVLAEILDGGTVTKYSLRTWNKQDKGDLMEQLVKAGYTKKQAEKWINDVNGIAAIIAADRHRLDFVANAHQKFLKDNDEYYFTLDASTLCAKRLLYQGTFNWVQHQMKNTPFMPEDLIDLVNIMREMGYETPCGICYVESRRRWLDKFANEWLQKFKGKKKPTLDQLTTSDGLEDLRRTDNETYQAFVDAMNKKGSSNPKVVQLRTEYDSDILKTMKKKDIQKVKDIGGLRIQSFSDFEVPHLLDMIQAVFDMASVKLTSQAYTKVPNFAWVFGGTGIKINLSLIGKGTGLDANGNLVFDNVEGMNFDEAMKLRDRYSKNVGTILVGMNDAHIIAAMGDHRIDFIIPFHKSGWSNEEIRKVATLNNYADYTAFQNERVIIGRESVTKEFDASEKEAGEIERWIRNQRADGKTTFTTEEKDGKTIVRADGYRIASFKKEKEMKQEENKAKGIKATVKERTNFEPVGANQYWDFSKSGEENAREYLRMCKEDGRMPKFWKFLVDDGEGGFMLPEGNDKESTAIREGYWKTLTDFKMYENDGYGRAGGEVKGSPQTEVTPNINMEQAERVLSGYELGRQMPARADGTAGPFIPMENNNALPQAIPAGELFVKHMKAKQARRLKEEQLEKQQAAEGIKVKKPTIAERAQQEEEINLRMLNSRLATAGYAGALTLGNTASEAEEYIPQKRQAMYADADRYSVARLDREYRDAVDSGDTATAQEIVDERARRAGYVNNGYHGTLNGGFTVFDKRKAHIGGNSGAGFYFSSNVNDSEANYTDVEGADNYFKAEHLAEKIQDYIDETGENEYAGVPIPEDASFDDLLDIAKKMLKGNPQTYHVYLNPGRAYIRDFNNSTNLLEDVYDGFDESDYNRDDFDSDDEYQEAIYEGRDEYLYEAINDAVYNAVADVDSNFEIVSNVDYQNIVSALAEHAAEYGELTWNDVKKVIEDQYIDALVGDGEESADATTEITRAIVEAFGFDSIEDREVSKKFNQLKNMGAADTVHYIMFRPEQIKLADPVTYRKDEDGNETPIPLEERFSDQHPDIRYSVRQPDMEVRQFMMGLNENSLQTAQEKTMLRQFKNLNMALEIAKHSLSERQGKLKALEQKENPSAFDKHQMQVLRNQIQNDQRKVDRLEGQMAQATGEKGYANLMHKQRARLENLVSGRTSEEVRATVEALTKQIQAAEKEIAERQKIIDEMDKDLSYKKTAALVDKAGVEKLAQLIRKEYVSNIGKQELIRAITEIRLKMAAGQNINDAVEELAWRIAAESATEGGEMLRSLRGTVIKLGKSQVKELLGNDGSLKELRSIFAGTGIKVRSAKDGEAGLDGSTWSELCDMAPSLDREAKELDQIGELIKFVNSQKAQMDGTKAYEGNMEEVTMDLKALIATVGLNAPKDPGAMKILNQMNVLVNEMAGGIRRSTEELQKTREQLAGMVDQGKLAMSQTDSMQYDIDKAIRYNNALAEQSEAALWKEEKWKLIEQLKSENTQKLLEEQERWKQKIAKDKQAREMMQTNIQLRKKIHTNVTRIGKLLFNETDLKNIPEHTKGLAREMLQMIEENDIGGRKITGIDRSVIREHLRILGIMEKQDGPFDADDLRLITDEEAQAAVLDALADIEDGIKFYNASTSGNIISNLQGFRNALERISDGVTTITNVIHAEQSINIQDRKIAVADAAGQVLYDMRRTRFKGERRGRGSKALNMASETVVSGNTTPVYFFKNLRNRGMMEQWDELRRGENRNGLEMQKAQNFMHGLADKYNYKAWADQKHTVKIGSQKVEMTVGNMMELYAIWKREMLNMTNNPQASSHLRKGGIFIDQGDATEGRLRREQQTMKAMRVRDEDVGVMYDQLTDEQKAYLDDVVKYLSSDMSDLGNEASMKMYGIKKYKEDWYFPMKIWDGVKSARSDRGISGTNDNRAAHKGWSKRRINKANNALVIGDFTTDAVNHIVEMINYNTMAPAIENLNKILNYKIEEMDDTAVEDNETVKRNVRIAFEEAYGKQALKYLETFLMDLNGGTVQDQRKTLRERALSMFKKNAVAGSLSVALQQPLSYIRAMMMINPADLARALSPAYWKGSHEEMNKYSGVSVIKDMGRFDMNFGQSAKDYIAPEKKSSLYGTISDRLTVLPELMDRMTWTRMWSACKIEQHRLNPEMDVNSDEFLAKVADRFNEVMQRTQVYDSVMVKSQNMRSNNFAMKVITSFMAEPTLSLNVLADAVRNVNEKGGKGVLASAVGTFLLSAALQAAFKGVMGSGRSPDEKKTWWENFLYKWWTAFIGEANPMSLIPGYSDVIEVAKSGKLADDAMGVLGKIKTVIDTARDTISGKKEFGYRTIEDTAAQLAQLFTNIPAKNLMRDGRAIYNWVTQEPYANRPSSGAVIRKQTEAALFNADNLMGTINAWLGDAGFKTTNKAYYGQLFSAMQSGNQAEADEIREYLQQAKGVDEKAINSGLKAQAKARMDAADASQWMIDNDMLESTSTLTTQYKKGEISAEEFGKMAKAVDPKLTDEDIWWKIDRMNYQKETDADEVPSGYDYRLKDAVDKGSTAEFRDQKVLAMKHGRKADDIESSMKTYVRNLYRDGEITRAQADEKLKKFAGMDDANDRWFALDQLDYQKETKADKAPSGTYYRLNDAVNQNSAAKIQSTVKNLMAHGVTQKKILDHMSDWKQEYLAADKNGKIKIRDAIQKVYKAAGSTAAEADKKINKWK